CCRAIDRPASRQSAGRRRGTRAGERLAVPPTAGRTRAEVIQQPKLPERPRQRLPPRHPLQDLREGAAFVFGHPLLRPIFLTQFIFNTAFFVLQAVYVPYAVHRLGLSASGVGATLATYGGGMVVGALLAPRVIQALPF